MREDAMGVQGKEAVIEALSKVAQRLATNPDVNPYIVRNEILEEMGVPVPKRVGKAASKAIAKPAEELPTDSGKAPLQDSDDAPLQPSEDEAPLNSMKKKPASPDRRVSIAEPPSSPGKRLRSKSTPQEGLPKKIARTMMEIDDDDIGRW